MPRCVKYRELRRTGQLAALCASVILLGFGSTGDGATIHVDGTALGPGDGSPSRPFRTINRAVVAAAPGDTIAIRNGSYPEKLAIRKQLTISTSGGAVVIEGRAFVRLDIRSLDPNGPELAAIRSGIQAMQSRPATDPTSWIYQANMHGTTDRPLLPAWETCQHGSFFFFSWHRMYLYYWERILRAASGDPFLVLPYWNYSDGSNPNARQLPFPFRQPQNAANPLFISQRNTAMNNGGMLPPSSVTFATAFARTNFDSPTGSGNSFGGQRVSGPQHSAFPAGLLELTPHGAVHVDVGGWMSTFEFAARDPIFWLHHANIDRLWERWLDQGGGRANSSDPVWLNTQFQFFNEAGQSVSRSGQNVLDTVNHLEYMYDDDVRRAVLVAAATSLSSEPPAPEPVEMEQELLASSRSPAIELGREPVTLAIDLPEAEQALAAVTEAREGQIVLNINGVEFDQIPEGHYEIYINLPEGAEPDFKDKHYVGNMSFFGIAPHDSDRHEGGEGRNAQFSYDITNVIRDLRASGDLEDGAKLKITFVKRGVIPPPDMPVAAVEREPVVPVTILRVTVTSEIPGT